MGKIRIGLLCDNRVAVPVMQRMAQEGVLCGVATTDRDAETGVVFTGLAGQAHVPYRKITQKEFAEQITAWVKEVQADAVFVINFPWRIGAQVLRVPRLGFLNFHYGLLPEMRGADPVFESIRQRMTVAGATVHVMDEGLDTGPVVLRRQMDIQPGLTYGMLSSQMAMLGAEMCGEILNNITTSAIGSFPENKEGVAASWCGMPLTEQDETKAKYWPKIGEAEMTINWQEMDSAMITALVLSCNPVAKGVPTTINGWKIGVCDLSVVNLQGDASGIKPGTIVAMDMQNGLIVYCKDGKGLKLDVVYTAEGVFPGYKLAYFNVTSGMIFGN